MKQLIGLIGLTLSIGLMSACGVKHNQVNTLENSNAYSTPKPNLEKPDIKNLCSTIDFYARWDLKGDHITPYFKEKRSKNFRVYGSKKSRGTRHNQKRADSLNRKICRSLIHYADDIIKKPLHDAENFCPNYNQFDYVDRLRFFVYYFSVKSEMESFFDSNAVLAENKGLFQLSQPEVDRYYKCGVGPSDNLKKDSVNIKCGVKMFSSFVNADRVIEDCTHSLNPRKNCGASRWWGVLRKRHINKFQAKARKMPGCV